MERRTSNNCPTAHKAPPAPYYAVIFSSTLADDAEGYSTMADRMVALAKEQDGFLGVESASRTSDSGSSIVSMRWPERGPEVGAWRRMMMPPGPRWHPDADVTAGSRCWCARTRATESSGSS